MDQLLYMDENAFLGFLGGFVAGFITVVMLFIMLNERGWFDNRALYKKNM